jgi:hypothetical protein
MAVFNEQYVMSNLSPNNQRPFRDPLELPDVANTLDMDDELKANSYTGGLNVNKGILQSLTDKGKEAFGFIKDKGAMIGGGIASAITGIPFLGTAFQAIQRPGYPSDDMSKSFAYGNENSVGFGNYYDDLRHGNLTGQDEFGINTISHLGNYPAYYDKYVKDYEDGKYNPNNRFAFNKYMHGLNVRKKNQERIEKDFFVNDDNDGNDNVPTPPNTNNVDGGGGGDGTYGLDSAGQKSYDTGQGFGSSSVDGGPVSNKTGRGRTGYFFGGRVNFKNGGLASIL